MCICICAAAACSTCAASPRAGDDPVEGEGTPQLNLCRVPRAEDKGRPGSSWGRPLELGRPLSGVLLM